MFWKQALGSAWNTEGPFPASSGPFTSAPVHRQTPGIPRRFKPPLQNLRSIDVRMILMTAPRTVKNSLRLARSRVDMAAPCAGLARISGRHFDQDASRPRELIAKHVREARPSRVRDAASTATFHHPCDVQLLQHNDAVALGKLCRLDVQEVVACRLTVR